MAVGQLLLLTVYLTNGTIKRRYVYVQCMYMNVDIIHVCLDNPLEESYIHVHIISEVSHFEKYIEE